MKLMLMLLPEAGADVTETVLIQRLRCSLPQLVLMMMPLTILDDIVGLQYFAAYSRNHLLKYTTLLKRCYLI